MSFQDEVLPLLEQDIRTMHDGDSGPRKEMWSRTEPLTLFGAIYTTTGRTELERTFDLLAGSWRGSRAGEVEIVAAEATGDLGYTCAIERSSVVQADGSVATYALRVTTVFRRENDAWKIVHRHGSPLDDRATDASKSLR
ncbi:YybH family protein [Lentzea aerocolonigenes]|uniref:YybH family protein n=1 Tax=Lentzea aerocolonigenes TaxID=68170 RepID=UPI0006918FC8|nr:nuclear transport factor 2 family protein [Lentzea aerocolonigenes]MCP2241446.1 SnoaL-like domain-containing protein [Lentzea aerocolonigenes]